MEKTSKVEICRYTVECKYKQGSEGKDQLMQHAPLRWIHLFDLFTLCAVHRKTIVALVMGSWGSALTMWSTGAQWRDPALKFVKPVEVHQ